MVTGGTAPPWPTLGIVTIHCRTEVLLGMSAVKPAKTSRPEFKVSLISMSVFVYSQFQFSLIILLLLFVGYYRLSVWRQGSGLSRYWVLRLRLGRGTAAVLWHLPVLQSAHTRPGFQQHCTAQYDMIKLTKYDIIWWFSRWIAANSVLPYTIRPKIMRRKRHVYTFRINLMKLERSYT